MSEHQKRDGVKKQQNESIVKQISSAQKEKVSMIEERSPDKSDGGNASESDAQEGCMPVLETYEQAQHYCLNQMKLYLAQNMDKSQEDQEIMMLEAKEKCQQFLQQYQLMQNQALLVPNEGMMPPDMHQQVVQQYLLQFQQAQMLAAGQQGRETGDQLIGAAEQLPLNALVVPEEEASSAENGENNSLLNNLGAQDFQQAQQMRLKLLQQQQTAMLYSQMGQNPEEGFSQIQQQQQKMQLKQKKQQMGNQLRLFAQQMFKKLNTSQKKKLEIKAKQYLDQCLKDQKKLQKSKSASLTADGTGSNEFDCASPDFEYQADSQKYLDEVESTIKKYKDLQDNFQRFIHKVFDDTEIEQVFTNFMIQRPLVYNLYFQNNLAYNHYHQNGDEENMEVCGNQIFNLIMPFTQSFDPRLIKLIPQSTLSQFSIEYDADNFHIKTWNILENDSSNNNDSSQGNSNDESGESSGSSNVESDSSSNGGGEVSSNHESMDDQQMGSVNSDYNRNNSDECLQNINYNSGQDAYYAEDNNNDMSQTVTSYRKKKRDIPTQDAHQHRMLGIPPSALTGKHKSLHTQLDHYNQNYKNINKNEVKPLDKLFQCLKDEKDWHTFCKCVHLYFEGVLSITELYMLLFDEKFSSKLKQDLKEELIKLLPTRDQNRRYISNLLKPWNDTENQTFERVQDSSYYKIEEGFPIPTCTMKMTDPVYFNNVNDKYLSLATGSENLKIRNTNEEILIRTEDKMYIFDTQIDNIEKSCKIISDQVTYYETLSEEDQNDYRFPMSKLSPLWHYWDQKLKKSAQDQNLKDGRQLKTKEVASLKHHLEVRLEYLNNQKNMNLNELKDHLRKNFSKSLDHKSFQFRDFMKKYLNKMNHIQKIKQISEENSIKKRHFPEDINILLGSGEQQQKSDYKFFNTFGKEFVGQFCKKRMEQLHKTPDHPIDMKFIEHISPKVIYENQIKFPQARFLMNDKLAFDISLKLLMNHVKIYCLHHSSNGDEEKLIKSLRFIMEKFLMVKDFDQALASSQNITPLDDKMVGLLLNSTDYYQSKYEGLLEPMQELFAPNKNPSTTPLQQSPPKINNQNANDQLNISVEIQQLECGVISPSTNQINSNTSERLEEQDKIAIDIEPSSQDKNCKISDLTEKAKDEQQSQCNLDLPPTNTDNQQKKDHASMHSMNHDGVSSIFIPQLMSQSSRYTINNYQKNGFRPIRLQQDLSGKENQLQNSNILQDNEVKVKIFDKEVQNSLFIPQFVQSNSVSTDTSRNDANLAQNDQQGANLEQDQDIQPSNSNSEDIDQKYKLFYAPTNLYMFITFFYSVYERILKAQELVSAKVNQDFTDDFSKQGWEIKFKDKQSLIDERFQYLIKAVYTVISQSNNIDTTKYEDIARELLGNEAYLLFQVDRLVNQCTKHISLLQNDSSYKISKKLFVQFEEDQNNKSESVYLNNFYKASNDCSIAQVNNPGAKEAWGAASVNKDPQINLQAFRLMYSPVSQIMTVHFIVLNPFCLQDIKLRRDGSTQQVSPFPTSNGGLNAQETLDSLKNFTNEKYYQFYDEEMQVVLKPLINDNKINSDAQPVFLNRNLRKMKQIRKDMVQKKKLCQKNGLRIYLLPLIKQIQFESSTEDYLHYNRQMDKKSVRSQDQQKQLLVKRQLSKAYETRQLIQKKYERISSLNDIAHEQEYTNEGNNDHYQQAQLPRQMTLAAQLSQGQAPTRILRRKDSLMSDISQKKKA